MHLLWFWGQPPTSHPLPKPCKCWLSNAFLMILKPLAPSRALSKTWKTWRWWQSYAVPLIPNPAAPLPATSKTMKMITVLYISDDSGANRPLRGRFQNHKNDNSPLHFLWCWGKPPPSRLSPKPWKCELSFAFLMILKPIAPLPPSPKTWKW